MSRCLAVMLALSALILASCSSNSSLLSTAGGGSPKAGFSVRVEPGSTFDTSLELATVGAETRVAIWAEDAVEVSGAYFHLDYDAGEYAPVAVEVGEFLGQGDAVLNLALTGIAGEVPVGLAQVKGAAVPVSGRGLLATVVFKHEPFTGGKAVRRAPDGTVNQVSDLLATPNGTSSATLQWTEKNVGDYDNNSEVGITDLQPLANFIFQKVNETSDPVWAGLMDGDGNGEINLADIQPIAANFGATVRGYQVYLDWSGVTPVEGGNACYCLRPSPVNPKVPVKYEEEVNFTEGTSPTFTVRPVANDGSSTTGALSNAADVVIITEPPLAPANLLALAGPSYGAGVIHLEWDGSTSEYLTKYEIQRKLASEDDSAWAKVIDVNASSTLYNDSGLADGTYDYRVYAWNAGNLESTAPSNTATNSPWFLPPPSPPINVAAVPGTIDSSINITWAAPLDDSAERFYLYRQAPGESGFTMLYSTINASETNYTDQGLSTGETYEYYVTSVQGFGAGAVESAPSNTANSIPKEPTNVTITGLTTDKTTHHKSGSEPAANIEATFSGTPAFVTWECTLGDVTGTGASVTWAPPAGSAAQNVTVTCNVNGDSKSLTLHVVDYAIKTNFTGSPPGHYVDFTLPLLEAINEGGTTINDRPMSWFVDGQHVVIFDRWETW
jgi:fibronectin type 3 domain-containing protein